MKPDLKTLFKSKIDKYGLLDASKMLCIEPKKLIDDLELPYKVFEDIKFELHPYVEGVKSYIEFENGYAVSIIKTEYSYGGTHGLYELAILKDGDIVYDTPITNDVVGHLTPEEVTEYMLKIQDLC